jgi:hypothetical protein
MSNYVPNIPPSLIEWENQIYMYGVCGAQSIFAENVFFDAELFTKHVIFKAHPLTKEQEVFRCRTKSLS